MYLLSKPEQLFHSSKPVVSIEYILNGTGMIFWLIKLHFKSIVSRKIWVPGVGHIYIFYSS
jgi:hypothetical protein